MGGWSFLKKELENNLIKNFLQNKQNDFYDSKYLSKISDLLVEIHKDELKIKIGLEIKAESLMCQTRKRLVKFGDKIDQNLKNSINDKLEKLEFEIQTDDVNKISSLIENLQKEIMKVGQTMYSKEGSDNQNDKKDQTNAKSGDSEVIDADFSDKK